MKNIKNKGLARVKIVCAVVVIASVISGGVYGVVHSTKKDDTAETVSKETTVAKGNLTVGVTESGSIEIGTVTQNFELEPVTASVSSSSSQSSSGSSSGGSSGSSSGSGSSGSGSSSQKSSGTSGAQSTPSGSSGGTTGTSSGSTKTMSATTSTGGVITTAASNSTSSSTSSSSALVVESVSVSTGQVVKKGDEILKVTSESLAAYKKELQATVDTANLALKQAKLDRDQQKVEAEYTYKSNKKLGTTAKAEYDATIAKLAKAVSDAQEAIDDADEQLSSLKSQITSTKKTLTSTKKKVSSATNEQEKSQLEQQVSSLESQVESLQSQYDTIKSNYSTLTSNLSSAKRSQSTEAITAKQEYEASMLTYNNADSIYQIAIDGIDDDVTSAETTLKEAKEVLSYFNDYVGDGVIKASVSGTVMTLGYSAGDSLSTDTAIATYSNAESVTMTVSVSQEDISVVNIGDTVAVEFTAYEGETYEATVSTIETAKNNSSTVSYNVTVTLSGDVAKIYTGMTGNVTFITKEVKDVLYVSNKAITTSGTESYVVKQENGVKTKTQVTTGFSDGNNVEIVSGLKEGDTVIIESQVNLS